MHFNKVIHAINGDFDWSIDPISEDIKKLVLNFAHVEISYISILFNFVSNWVFQFERLPPISTACSRPIR